MRFSTVVVGCLVAACSGDEGVALEVTSDVDIDRIELFVATGHDGSIDGITWNRANGEQMRPPGDLYYIQHDEEVVASTLRDGEKLVMRLQTTSSHAEPKVIAIVGFSNEVPVAAHLLWYVRVPQHSAETWQVHLEATDPVSNDTMTAPGPEQRTLRAETWKTDTDTTSRCLALQLWGGDQWKGMYVVPETDPDCDGHTELECRPRIADFEGASSCLFDRTSQEGTTCQVGARVCKDGVAGSDACLAARSVCVPDSLCEACVDSASVMECARDAIAASTGVGHVACRFEPDVSTNERCAAIHEGNTAEVVLPADCASVSVHPLDTKLDEILPANTTSTFVAGGATFQITALNADTFPPACKVVLEWKTGPAITPHSEWLVAAVHGFQSATMLVPLEIQFDAGRTCTGQGEGPLPCITSTDLAADGVWDCISP